MAVGTLYVVTTGEVLVMVAGSAIAGGLVLLVWLRRPRVRQGRRCPRCLRPWRTVVEQGWCDLEREARAEHAEQRRQQARGQSHY